MGLLARLRRPAAQAASGDAVVAPVHFTWLQSPAFEAAGFRVKCVGESHYQHVLEWASGGRTQDGARQPLVTAQLVREATNPYDADAVRVDLGGQTAAYVPRHLAPAFHAPLAKLDAAGTPATCRAWLTGGWERGAIDRGNFGLELDLHPNLELSRAAVLLPFADGRVSITGEEEAQEFLSELLRDTDRQEVVAVLEVDGDRVVVRTAHSATTVGQLTPKMSERYRGLVTAVTEHGQEATCQARVIRGPKKIEFFLKVAKPWD